MFFAFCISIFLLGTRYQFMNTSLGSNLWEGDGATHRPRSRNANVQVARPRLEQHTSDFIRREIPKRNINGKNKQHSSSVLLRG